MRVAYVSKALVVAAYRDKIRELGQLAAVTAVIPHRWGKTTPEPSPPGMPEPRRVPARLTGHNHLHHYARPDRWLAQIGPDLVHVDEEPYSLVTLQLSRLCRRRRVPFVFFAWQNIARRLPPPFGLVRAAVLRAAAGGIAGTPRAAEVLSEAGFAGPMAVIPQFGVDTEVFRPDPSARRSTRERLGIEPGTFVVGYAGRLVPEKGVDVLVRAFARLAPDGGDAGAARLLVVGDGPDRPRLETVARESGAGDRVLFRGATPSLEMPAVLNAMDVLVLPSVGTRTWSEQFGRVLVEAMACGVPVIGTATGEIPWVVGDAGRLVPPGGVEPLRAALDGLRRDPVGRRRTGEAGLRRARDRFTQATIARGTAAFYRELLERRQ